MRVDVQRHYSKCGADNIEELDLRTYPFQEGMSNGGPSRRTHIGLLTRGMARRRSSENSMFMEN